MPVITFSDFAAGLDLRKGASVSDANRLRVLDNCYVTTGKTIRKRPGLVVEAVLESGTKGLTAAGGKLNTFCAAYAVTHADTRFVANQIKCPTDPSTDLKKIHFADSFNGFLYISAEYVDDKIFHHYMDGTSAVAPWVDGDTLSIGDERRPITENGYRYEVTAAGVTSSIEPTWSGTPGNSQTESFTNYDALIPKTKLTKNRAYRSASTPQYVFQCVNDGVSGPTEPVFSSTVGGTVTDDGTSEEAWDDNKYMPIGSVIRPVTANGFTYQVTTAGTTGATQPTWPVVPGGTVANGTVTFTCRGQAIWTASTMHSAGVIRKPTASNNYWFECTVSGASAITEPTWTTTVGATVTEKDSTATAWVLNTALTLGAIRRPTVANGLLYEVTTAGTTGASQPSWPTTPGDTVTNGGVVFTCRNRAVWTCREKAVYKTVNRPAYKCHMSEIYDPLCPNTAAVAKKASKVFAVKDDVVRFSKTNNPRDWTTASDAGFIGVGIQQSGATNPTALGDYAGNLVVFFSDSSQVWSVDPDPALMKFVQGVDVGCPYPNGAANMAGDVFFASYDGVRSVTTQSTTGSLIDVDVGSPIDSVLKPILSASASVKSFYFRGGGQFWTMIGANAYVYSFSRTSKISAWSRYTFPFTVSDVTEMNGELYFRSGDTVYRLDEATYTDAGTLFDVKIEFPFLDFQAPGVLKMVTGMDAVMVGSMDIAHRYDARTPSLITQSVSLTGDTRPGETTPVEVCTVGLAPVLTSRTNQPFELHALTFQFEPLGSMS